MRKKTYGNYTLWLFYLFVFFFGDPQNAATRVFTVCTEKCDAPSIQALFDIYNLEPGDEIEIRADKKNGTKTYYENIIWGSDDIGSKHKYVTLRSRSNDRIIISGAIPISGFKKIGYLNCYKVVSLRKIYSIIENKKKILRKVKLSNAIGKGEWAWKENDLYYSPSNGILGKKLIEGAVHKYCIEIPKKEFLNKNCYIAIKNIEIRGAAFDGILSYGNFVKIENCVINTNGGGRYGGSGVRVSEKGCKVKNIILKNCTIFNNYVDGCYFEGIKELFLYNNKIFNNDISNTTGDALQLINVNVFEIINNKLSNRNAKKKGDVVVVDSNNGRIDKNQFKNAIFGLGISGSSNIKVRYNISKNNKIEGYKIGENNTEILFCYNIAIDNADGIYVKDSKGVSVLNNSFINNKRRSVEIKGDSQVRFINNMVYAKKYDRLLMIWPKVSIIHDHNFYGHGCKGIERHPWRLKNKNYVNLKNFKENVYPQGKESKCGEYPYIYDKAQNKYILKKISKLLNGGRNVGLLNDFYGVEVPKYEFIDIGAIEAE